MKISNCNNINFQRRLKASEEAEYTNVLKQAKDVAAGGKSNKSVLIVPVTSLPQAAENNTGVGNLAAEESIQFFNFAKKYWGINEVQLLPIGQYHEHYGNYPIYSGTTMDFGNHIINLKSFLSKENYDKLVKNNKLTSRANFSNIVDGKSYGEQLLRQLYQNIPDNLKSEFENYKKVNGERLRKKSIYRTLSEIHNTVNYKKWPKNDANLFDPNVVSATDRDMRIAEILKTNNSADFFIFKQFLAEKSFKNAKRQLNSMGLKLNGDMPCGFALEEYWSNPKAFLKDSTIGWGLPALDYSKAEAENLLREKVRFYAQNFDGFRVDAAWTYAEPIIHNTKTNSIIQPNYDGKFLNIIEDEVKKVKGQNYDLHNITYEFAADPKDFNVYDGNRLKYYAENRMKIYTSEHLSNDWGSAKIFIDRGWNPNTFILGVANHDSKITEYSYKQAEILSNILKIPMKNLRTYGDFLNAKFAEPFSGKNTMLFFMNALGLKGQFKGNSDKTLNYTAKIPENFEENYHKALQNKEAFNPMDALEKQFKSQGLDKSEPELFKKITKYRKILGQKEKKRINSYISLGVAFVGLVLLYVACKLNHKTDKNK